MHLEKNKQTSKQATTTKFKEKNNTVYKECTPVLFVILSAYSKSVCSVNVLYINNKYDATQARPMIVHNGMGSIVPGTMYKYVCDVMKVINVLT